MNPLQYKDQVYSIIGAAMAVHRNLGEGLLEPIYNEALVMELEERGITAEREQYLPCYYKKRLMEKSYRMDVVVGDIVVELKSVQKIVPAHRSQLFNYLRLTRKPIGLLINFGSASLQGERYAYDEEENTCYLLDRNMEAIPMEEEEGDWYADPYAALKDKMQ